MKASVQIKRVENDWTIVARNRVQGRVFSVIAERPTTRETLSADIKKLHEDCIGENGLYRTPPTSDEGGDNVSS